MTAWGPRLPSMRSSLALDNAGLGLVLAGVTVGAVLGLLASSPIFTTFGPRRGIGAALMATAVSLALIGVGAGPLHSVPVTALGFAVVGFSIGALDVMINVEGAAVERAAGRTLMPLMHAGWSLGAVVGSGIGAACAALRIAFAVQFAAEAVLIVVVGLVVARHLPSGVPAEAAEERPPVRERFREWLSGWTHLRLLVIGLVMLGVELGEGSANNWLTLAVRDGHRQTDAVAAAFFIVFAVGETAARVLGGPLVDRIGRVAAIRVTTAIGVVGLVLFILGGPAWVVLVGILFWAVGVSLGFPLGMSAAAESGPNPAARTSVVASIGYLANLAGPPAIGALSERVGLLEAMWVILALLVVGFLCAGALRPPRAERPASGDPT